jgi:cell filamentation protein, protein adenylyltransferase
MATDPYVYPGTTVLKNLPGIQNYDRLQQFEAVSTANRISELRLNPIAGPFDITHLQSIHRHIFQDVYSWAGELRIVDIRKEGEFWFCRHEFITQALSDLLKRLQDEDRLLNIELQRFAARAGYYMNELNAIHPFREGNGRAQREFIRELGFNAGLHVNWTKVSQDQMYSASIAGFQKGDSGAMEALIEKITTAVVE